MKLELILSPLAALLLLAGCGNKQPAPAASTQAPHATVQMRDGTSFAGTVASSSPTELKLTGDDGVSHTIPMSQVRSIDYGETANAQPPAASPAQPPVSAPQPAAPPPQAAAPPPPAEAPANVPASHPAERTVTTRTFVLPAGAHIPVRVEETIDSAKAVEGQTFAAEVARVVRDRAGDVVIPRGANARIIIRSASKGGKFRGTSDLVLDLASVSIDGRRYQLETVDIAERGKEGIGANKRTGKFAGGGAAIGAIIGAIAGGGKGAAIGAGSGAAAGAAGQILTKGSAVKVPVESVLTFQLERELRVVAER
jgi:hypothetical protein